MKECIHVAVFAEQSITLSVKRNKYYLLEGKAHEKLCEMIETKKDLITDTLDLEPIADTLQTKGFVIKPFDYRSTFEYGGINGVVWHERYKNHVQTMKNLERLPWKIRASFLTQMYTISILHKAGWLSALLSAAHPKVHTQHIKENINPKTIVNELGHLIPYMPFLVECLVYAATLTRVLRKNGHHAELVIGVRPKPFEAHAWSMIGSSVVGDDDTIQENIHMIYRGRSAQVYIGDRQPS